MVTAATQGAYTIAILATMLLVTSIAIADPAQIELGAEVYVDYCQGCHGDDKSGLADYNDSLENFSERLEGVTENMPDFAGFFDDDEILALHAYLMDTGE